MTKIFINPGHCPGVDPGACNEQWDINEAEIVRNIGDILQDELEERGYEVDIEQSDNLCGENSSRGEWQSYEDSVCAKANDGGADYFISLHCNSCTGYNSATGTEVFYASYEGSQLAQAIQDELLDTLGSNDRGTKIGNFMVLTHTAMTAVLVEIEFINSDKGAQTLLFKQKEIAKAIARGVSRYVG